MILRSKKFLGKNNIIYLLMSEGLNLGTVHFTVQIHTLGLLGEYYRNMEILGCNTGNADTGSLDSKNFGNGTI